MAPSDERKGKRPMVSPLPSLTAFIASHPTGHGLISFPPGTKEDIQAYESLGTNFSTYEIGQLVDAIEGHNYQFCSNLDQLSLGLLCSIITHSDQCGARSRGCHLLAKSLHPAPTDSNTFKAQRLANKRALCVALPHLLKHLARGPEHEAARRWMSVLALELLEGCPENVQSLKSKDAQEWQGLIKVMKHCKCEILRILTASIVRQLLFDGLPAKGFWTPQDDADSRDKFPISPRQDIQWMKSFQGYVQDAIKKEVRSTERSYVAFAHAVTIGRRQFMVDDATAILVTFSTQILQFYVRVSPEELATHVDIPFTNIASQKLNPIADGAVKKTMSGVTIYLANSEDATYFVDAFGEFDKEVRIMFSSSDEASNLMRVVQSKIAKFTQKLEIADSVRQNLDDGEGKVGEQCGSTTSAQRKTQKREYSDMEAIASQATSLLAVNEQALAPASQLNSQCAQVVSPRQKRQGLARSEGDNSTMMEVPDSLDVEAHHSMKATRSTVSKPSQALSVGAMSPKNSSTAISEQGNCAPGNPQGPTLQSTAQFTSKSHHKSNDKVFHGSKQRKKAQQTQNSAFDSMDAAHIESNAKRRKISPKRIAAESKKVGALKRAEESMPLLERPVGDAGKGNEQRANQVQHMNMTNEEQDPYEFPSSPAPPSKDLSAQRFSGPATGNVSKRHHVEIATTKSKIQNVSGEEQNAPNQAPNLLKQPKSRRAAAIHANEKIQGVDNAALNSQAVRKQNSSLSKKKSVKKKEVAVNDTHAGVQHDSIETVRTADETRFAVKRPLRDAIETEEDMNDEENCCGNGKVRSGVTKADDEKTKKRKQAASRTDGETHDPPKSAEAIGNSIIAENSEHVPVQSLQQSGESAAVQNQTNDNEAHQGGEMSDILGVSETNPTLTDPKSVQEHQIESKHERGTTQHQDQVSPLKKANVDHLSGTLPKNTRKVVVSNAKANEEKIKNTPREHAINNDTPASQDPFSSKLHGVVRRGDGSNIGLLGSTNEAGVNPDGNRPLGNRPAKLASALLQEGQDLTLNSRPEKPAKRSRKKTDGSVGNSNKNPKVGFRTLTEADVAGMRTPPLVTRKPVIISFSASGPRNQGTVNKKRLMESAKQGTDAEKAQLAGESEQNTCVPEEARSTSVAMEPFGQPEQSTTQKAAAAEVNETCDILQDEEPIAFANEVQSEVPKHQIAREVNSEALKSMPNSQTTRVDHKGSPMPTRHLTNDPAFVPSIDTKLLKDGNLSFRTSAPYSHNVGSSSSSYDGDDDSDDDNGELEGCLEPATLENAQTSQELKPQAEAKKLTNAPKKRNQKPASPQRPTIGSAFRTQEIHRNSEILNTNNSEPIVAANPLNAPVAKSTERSLFFRLLESAREKDIEQPAQITPIDRQNQKRSSKISLPDDPDKTLVEPSRSIRKTRSKKKRVYVSNSSSSGSSSSLSSSEDEEPSRTLVEDNTEETPNQWIKSLLPHQKNALDVLMAISHRFVAQMIKGENAFMDQVADFKKGSHHLIDHLAKELEIENTSRDAAIKAVEEKLISAVQKADDDLEKHADQVQGRWRRMEDEVQAQQQALLASVDAALARCKH